MVTDDSSQLDARTTVAGYGWKSRIGRSRSGTHDFWLSCKRDRPRHTVDWTFALVDDGGNRSNAIQVPVECTGEPMPGSAPSLDAVELPAELPLAGKTPVTIQVRSTHPPVVTMADIKTRGNAWTATYNRTWKDGTVGVACLGGTPHLMDFRFRVRDSFGRVSNVVEKRLNCGGCR
jgi:hypothetical protein